MAQLKTLLNKNVLSLDLKHRTELQHKTDSGRVFHKAGAACRKARLANSVRGVE